MSNKLKLAFIGDSVAGKSHILNVIINNFINNFALSENIQKTIGFDYYVRNYELNKVIYELTFYDFSGDTKYQSIIDSKNYYHYMDGIFIVFDISNRQHIDNLSFWINKVSKFNKFIYILANKSDLESKYIFHAKSIVYDLAMHSTIHNYMMISITEPESIKYILDSIIDHIKYSKPPLIEPITNTITQETQIKNNDKNITNTKNSSIFDNINISKLLSFLKKK